MGQPDYIFGQFRETARCRYAQHGDGVCCAFAPQLVVLFTRSGLTNKHATHLHMAPAGKEPTNDMQPKFCAF